MTRKSRIHRFDLMSFIVWLLAGIGKPVFFIFSHLFIGLTFILLILVKFAKDLSSLSIQKYKELISRLKLSVKSKNFKKILKRQIRKRRKLLKKKVQRLVPAFKLESLKIALFGLKILSNLKKLILKKPSRREKIKIRIRVGVLLLILLLVSGGTYFYFYIFRTLPPASDLMQKTPAVSTKIYDRNGNLLYKFYKDENRSIVRLSQIPIHVRLATLAAEDAEFYDHPGFSVKGILRAIFQDIQTGSLQGGSTITQQLVKNVLLSPEKTFTRKIKEIVLSIEVEATYTKDQILELYLNQVSYGGTSYGIEAASQEFFGKDVANLDLAEAAFLAGLPQSPTTYSPYGQTSDSGIERQREVLRLMVINKFITAEQEKAAESEKLTFMSSRNSIRAPHFVMYIKNLLVQKYGEEMLQKGGLEVTTSLDLRIQNLAEQTVKSEVTKLKGLNVGNGDALVLNPQTGEILSMVGSTDYFDSENDGQVNVTTRLRQPGSSIKAVNYAYALDKGGYTPASVIIDSPITYIVPGSPPYSPVNYDSQFRGPITLRSALAQSRNIPAVKVLASYGVSKMVKEGEEMGITSWNDPSKFGLSLTLGGGAVTALDLATVYSTIANDGKRPDLIPILQVKDYKGAVLERNTPKSVQVLDPKVAFLLTDILKDNNARAPEFGFNSYLVVKNHPEVAVKTGTSNDLRDNWTAGYNQNFLVVTWVGNNDNSPMSRIASGVTGASPIWNIIMSALLNDQPSIDWKIPEGVVRYNCPGGKSEWFKSDNIPQNFCNPLPTNNAAATPQSQILTGAATEN